MYVNWIGVFMASSKLQEPSLIYYQCLLHLEFYYGKTDLSLFILRKGQPIVLLLIYVNDIIVTWNYNNIINDLIRTLSSEFSLKDLGSLHYFLSLEDKYSW